MRLINARVQRLCPDPQEKDTQAEGADVLSIALELEQMQALQDAYLADAYTHFLIINSILVGLVFLARLIPNPLLRVAARGAQVAQVQVAGLLSRTISQQAAANDMNFLINVLKVRGRLAA